MTNVECKIKMNCPEKTVLNSEREAVDVLQNGTCKTHNHDTGHANSETDFGHPVVFKCWDGNLWFVDKHGFNDK